MLRRYRIDDDEETRRDIEVRNEMGGRPKIALGGAARELCEKLGVDEVLITISHCRTHATAYALAVGRQMTNDE